MKVTYLMPTVRSRFIQKALNSVLNQTLTDWELIILNGCPRRELVVPDDDRISVVHMFGLSTEMINVGVGMARSDVILFIADDDEDLPNRAQVVYDEIQAGADIFCGSSYLINEEGLRIGEFKEVGVTEDSVLMQGPPSLKAGGYRKSACPKWTNEVHCLSDNVFFLESFKEGLNIKVSSEILSNSRDWAGNISSSALMNIQVRRSETFRLRKVYGPRFRCNVTNNVINLPLEAFG